MIRTLALILCAAVLLAFEPVVEGGRVAQAQGNDNDYTPLNSRIRRDRQFPLEPQTFYERRELTRVGRNRSRNMVAQFGRCMWSRSNEDSLAFLALTDFGFVNFEQIGWSNEDVDGYFPIGTCLDRIAYNNRSGLRLNYTHAGIRQWLLEQAYLDANPDGPTWAQPGFVIGERSYPVSAQYQAVHVAMNFADCVVATNPVEADYFFRTEMETEEEAAAIQRLLPAISGCLPQGQQMEIEPYTLRVWLGEGLWHASNNSSPAPLDTPEDEQ